MAETASQILERHRRTIPGGVMSLNRAMTPMRCFTHAKGAYIWDHEGQRYIDYHAAFAPYLLGHADDDVDDAVIDAVRGHSSLIGAGTTPWEGDIAERLVDLLPAVDQVQLTSSGSEAVVYALRLARAATGRDGVIVMQGGYNGWGDAVAFNLMDPVEAVRDHEDGTEYPLRAISAGIPMGQQTSVHVVEYNDLAAVDRVLATGSVAAVILEPILQNVGVVKPKPGYLEGLRDLCDRHGSLLIFDEIKTGFRHGLSGYQGISGVMPDLSTFGKAVANGYPMGVVGGRREVMELCEAADPMRRVLIAGTYNAHPFTVAAGIATIDKLRQGGDALYQRLDALGQRMEDGLNAIFAQRDYPATVVRQGSAFTVYFMDHAPEHWRDIACNNDAARDTAYRRALVERGVFHFPVTTKQGSISCAHTEADIDRTLEITEDVVRGLP